MGRKPEQLTDSVKGSSLKYREVYIIFPFQPTVPSMLERDNRDIRVRRSTLTRNVKKSKCLNTSSNAGTGVRKQSSMVATRDKVIHEKLA